MDRPEPRPSPPARDPLSIVGFAVGVGAAALALLGTPWHFARPEASSWLVYPVSFLVGAALGAAWAAWRGVSTRP